MNLHEKMLETEPGKYASKIDQLLYDTMGITELEGKILREVQFYLEKLAREELAGTIDKELPLWMKELLGKEH